MNQTSLLFRFADGRIASDPTEWLSHWASRYPRHKYPPIGHLIVAGSSGLLSSEDIEWVGRWKDGALNGNKWKANMGSVAYDMWMLASSKLPGVRLTDELSAAEFLNEWVGKSYQDTYTNGSVRTKKFGLSRASTLLHLMSGGAFPILDGRVRLAVRRLTGFSVSRDDIKWYLAEYRPLFKRIMKACQESDVRRVDEALFSYGGKNLKILDAHLGLQRN